MSQQPPPPGSPQDPTPPYGQPAPGEPPAGASPGQGGPPPPGQYGPPPTGPGSGPYGPSSSGPGPAQPGQLSPQDERTWGMLAHISAILAALVGLSFLGPLLVMLVQGPKSDFVRRHSVEALNFQIATYIAAIASAVLIIVLIGLILLPAVLIAWLVLTIVAGVAANRGEDYRYPLNLRLIK